MKSVLDDLTGRQFGYWIVLYRAKDKITNKKTGKTSTMWQCKCICGREKSVFMGSLKTGVSTNCGCISVQNRKGRPSVRRLPAGEATFNTIYKHYQNSAQHKNLEFSLTVEYFKILTQNNCYYCGIEPNSTMKAVKITTIYTYNGIDRVDNTKGYIKDNVVSCCKMCNWGKRNFTVDKFLTWVKRVADYQESISNANSH